MPTPISIPTKGCIPSSSRNQNPRTARIRIHIRRLDSPDKSGRSDRQAFGDVAVRRGAASECTETVTALHRQAVALVELWLSLEGFCRRLAASIERR